MRKLIITCSQSLKNSPKDGLNSRKININEIWESAKVCRVQNIISPYMEAI